MPRKKMSEEEKKVRLPVCVSPAIRSKLIARACAAGMTLSQFCAKILKEKVENEC
jgi:hypothetical protein